jgi:hypothetical protein
VGIADHSRVVVGRTFPFAKKSRHNVPVGAAAERQAVVASTPWAQAGIGTCLIHHVELLKLHEMEAKQVGRDLPVFHAEGMKILSDRTGKDFAEIALQRLDVQPLRVSIRWIPFVRLAQGVQ